MRTICFVGKETVNYVVGRFISSLVPHPEGTIVHQHVEYIFNFIHARFNNSIF